jgi:hypothetical protein
VPSMLLGRGDKHDLPVAQSPQFFQACCVSSTLEYGVVHHSKLDSRCPLWAALYPESGRTDRGLAKSPLCQKRPHAVAKRDRALIPMTIRMGSRRCQRDGPARKFVGFFPIRQFLLVAADQHGSRWYRGWFWWVSPVRRAIPHDWASAHAVATIRNEKASASFVIII